MNTLRRRMSTASCRCGIVSPASGETPPEEAESAVVRLGDEHFEGGADIQKTGTEARARLTASGGPRPAGRLCSHLAALPDFSPASQWYVNDLWARRSL